MRSVRRRHLTRLTSLFACLRLITLRRRGFTTCRWGAQIVEFAPYQIAFIANLIIQARVPSEHSRQRSK